MKTYSGMKEGGAGGQRVQVAEGSRITILNASTDLWNHSPDGFQWGYGGSGPAQLALARGGGWRLGGGMRRDRGGWLRGRVPSLAPPAIFFAKFSG